jgi:hypothetical protein
MWLLLLFAVFLLSPAAQGVDGCVDCHTDPAKLRALAQEPAAVEDEGEG